jgi:hypothetical protein
MRYFKFLMKNIDKLLAGLVQQENQQHHLSET